MRIEEKGYKKKQESDVSKKKKGEELEMKDRDKKEMGEMMIRKRNGD